MRFWNDVQDCLESPRLVTCRKTEVTKGLVLTNGKRCCIIFQRNSWVFNLKRKEKVYHNIPPNPLRPNFRQIDHWFEMLWIVFIHEITTSKKIIYSNNNKINYLCVVWTFLSNLFSFETVTGCSASFCNYDPINMQLLHAGSLLYTPLIYYFTWQRWTIFSDFIKINDPFHWKLT